MGKRWNWLWAALLGLAALRPGALSAQDATLAQRHFELALQAMERKDWRQAVADFLKSHKYAPAPARLASAAGACLCLAGDVADCPRAQALPARPSDKRLAEVERARVDAFNLLQRFVALSQAPAATQHKKTDSERDAMRFAQRNLEELRQQVALVAISSTPAGAEITVDTHQLGVEATTDAQGTLLLAVEAGRRKLIATLPRHRQAEAEIEAKLGQARPLTLALEPVTGLLSLQLEPADTRIEVDGQQVQAAQLPLLVGQHRVVASAEFHATRSWDVEIVEGRTTVLQAKLAVDAQSGAMLTVAVEPQGMQLRIDDRPYGTKTRLGPLKPGPHTIHLEGPGRLPFADEVVLQPGENQLAGELVADPEGGLLPDGGGRRAVLYPLGVGLLGLGVFLGVDAASDQEAFFDDPRRQSKATIDAVNRQSVHADVLMLAGGAILLATGIWDLAEHLPDSWARVR